MTVELKGIDADIFLENLNREMPHDEIQQVRKWSECSQQK